MITIEGGYKRVGGAGKQGRKRRSTRARADASQAHGLGDLSTWWSDLVYGTFNPEGVASDTVAVTGTNNPNAADEGIVRSFQVEMAEAVAQLDDASARLDAAESALLSIQSAVMLAGTADDQARWTAEYNKVTSAQVTRDNARGALNQAAGWLQSVKSSLGLSGMGVLPAVPWSLVAGIAAAAAALYAVANGASQFFNAWQVKQWNAENIRRQAAGQTPLEGNPQLLDTSVGVGIGGIFRGMGETVKYAAIALLIFFVAPPLLRALERE